MVVWLWCGVSVVLVCLCALNWRVRGMPLIAAGVALNLVVVLLNTGMPVGGSLAASAGMTPSAEVVAAQWGFYTLVGPQTLATGLGDVIPVPLPRPLRSLVSIGDLLMFLGIGVLIEEGIHRERYRPRHAVGCGSS